MNIMNNIKNFDNFLNEWNISDPIGIKKRRKEKEDDIASMEKSDKEFREGGIKIKELAKKNGELPIYKDILKSVSNGEIKFAKKSDRSYKIELENGTKFVIDNIDSCGPDLDGYVRHNNDSHTVDICSINGEKIGERGYVPSDSSREIMKQAQKVIDTF